MGNRVFCPDHHVGCPARDLQTRGHVGAEVKGRRRRYRYALRPAHHGDVDLRVSGDVKRGCLKQRTKMQELKKCRKTQLDHLPMWQYRLFVTFHAHLNVND